MIWERLIGREVPRDAWIESEARANELRRQSERIARRLEGQGIAARVKRNSVTLIGMVSGEIAPAIEFRNSNLIPVMQSRNVHEMLKHVRYFFETTPARQLRMFVASNGWVPLSEYREAHKRFSRTLSRLAAEEWLKATGIEIVFFNIEDTIQRDPSGQVMFNMHAHMLVRARRYLGPVRWARAIERARGFLPKGYLHDEAIKSPAECVKYVFKPAEFDALTDEELARLYRATYRLKFFHPLGEIRRFRHQLERDGLKLVRVPEGNEKWTWRTIESAREPRSDKDDRRVSSPPCNVVVAITLPMPKFSPFFEPLLIVRDFNGDFDQVLQQRGISGLVARARAIHAGKIAAAGSPASMRHTTTTTVRADQAMGAPTGRAPPYAGRDGPLAVAGKER